MKLRQEHLRTLLNKIEELQRDRIPRLKNLSDEWLRSQQTERDAYHLSIVRGRLEIQLDKFRDELGEIYDFMSERGLRNINGE